MPRGSGQSRLPIPMYGVLADGIEPSVGMGVSIQDKTGSEVALGKITYLDRSDEEIRVKFLDGYSDAVSGSGFKFAVSYNDEIWVLGKFLRKLDDDDYDKRAAASEERLREQERQLVSPAFLSQLETGTSEFEPTWPGGSWSTKAAEDKYGLRAGMRFRYAGTSTVGGGFTHGKVLEIKAVGLGDPFYVWPNSDGPIAVCIDWGFGKSFIARPEGKLADRFGQTVRNFMANFKYIPKLQMVVTLRTEPSGSSFEVVCYSMGGDALGKVSPDPSWSVEELEAKLLDLDQLKPATDDHEVVFTLPSGNLVKDLPRDMTVEKAFAV